MCLLILTPFLRKENGIKGNMVAFWKTTLCCSTESLFLQPRWAGKKKRETAFFPIAISLESDNVFKEKENSWNACVCVCLYLSVCLCMCGLIRALSRGCILLSSESCQQMKVNGAASINSHSLPTSHRHGLDRHPSKVWLLSSSTSFLKNPPGGF